MLHNTEYYEMCNLFRECKSAVDEILRNSAIYQRTKGYINLANNNIDIVEKQVKHNNHFYEGAHSFKFYFNKGALITSSYEIQLSFRDSYNNYNSTSLGIDSFIILLDECGLLEDTKEEGEK